MHFLCLFANIIKAADFAFIGVIGRGWGCDILGNVLYNGFTALPFLKYRPKFSGICLTAGKAYAVPHFNYPWLGFMFFLPGPVTDSRDYVSDEALFSSRGSALGKALLKGENVYQDPAGQTPAYMRENKFAIAKSTTLYGYYSLKIQALCHALAVMCKTGGLFSIMFTMGAKRLCGQNFRPHNVLSALLSAKFHAVGILHNVKQNAYRCLSPGGNARCRYQRSSD